MQSVKKIIAAILVLCLSNANVTAKESDMIVVTLRGRAEPTSDAITVADIASVTGGDLITRRKISQLDLANLNGKARPSKLSKDRVRLRILLSGFAGDSFKVDGPQNTLLKVQDRTLDKVANAVTADSRVLDFLRAPMASRLGVPSEDVRIRIVRPISNEHRLLLDPESALDLEHFLPGSIRVGPQTAKIGLSKDGVLRKTMAVWLDVQMVREVFVANRILESGTTITKADITRERRTMNGQLASHLVSVPVGRVTRKQIPVGSIVSDLDLLRNAPKAKEFVVQNRDTVEIRVRRKALRVTVTGGMALQRGAVGDAIRVKNPRSGKVLTAHVVDSGTVEIRL